jgi:S1-C subfamily serine protease
MKLSTYLLVLFTGICLTSCSTQTPPITSEDYYNDGLNKIVKVYTDTSKMGGATGFMLKTNSNKYLVTAFHVCYGSILNKSNKVYIEQDNKILGYYQIVKTYKEYDVCLIEPVLDLGYYKLSNIEKSEELTGKLLFVVGHPLLNSLTVSQGSANGTLVLQIPLNDILMELFLIKTTISVFPGNSGSPVLYKGKVVGLVSVSEGLLLYAGITPVEFFKKIVEEN